MSVQEIRVCLNNRGDMRYSCMASGARETLKSVKSTFGETHLVKPWTCMGHCQQGPMICVIDGEKQEHFIPQGNLDDLKRVVESHGH